MEEGATAATAAEATARAGVATRSVEGLAAGAVVAAVTAAEATARAGVATVEGLAAGATAGAGLATAEGS